MSKYFITLSLLLGMYSATQCAEHDATPNLTQAQAAICRHYIYYYPHNWDALSKSLARNMFKSNPDITKKELVKFFRWQKERGRKRASVLPLSILQRIWHFIQIFQFVHEFDYEIKAITKEGPTEQISKHAVLSYLCHMVGLKKILRHPLISCHSFALQPSYFVSEILIAPLEDKRKQIVEECLSYGCDFHALYLYDYGNHAHAVLANNDKIIAIPYVSCNCNTASAAIILESILKACENNAAQCFTNFIDAHEYLQHFR